MASLSTFVPIVTPSLHSRPFYSVVRQVCSAAREDAQLELVSWCGLAPRLLMVLSETPARFDQPLAFFAQRQSDVGWPLSVGPSRAGCGLLA